MSDPLSAAPDSTTAARNRPHQEDPQTPAPTLSSTALGPAFEAHLRRLSATGVQVQAILSTTPDTRLLSQATFNLLWQALYNDLLKGQSEDLIKAGALIEKLYCAFTQRMALEQRTGASSSGAAVDRSTFSEIEAKLKLL
jgi:hypothetical protein